MKLLVSMVEFRDGIPTGRKVVRELHGDYKGIYSYLRELERCYSKRELLPIEECVIINSCGYIFAGSTNQMNYLEDFYASVK